MKTKTDWIQQADDALRRAARRARDVAERTRTPLHVMRDGKIVRLMPVVEDLALREEPPHHGTTKP
jgi:hypothetical protein